MRAASYRSPLTTQGRITPVWLIVVDNPETLDTEQPIGGFGPQVHLFNEDLPKPGLACTTISSHATPRELDRLREQAEEGGAGLWNACPHPGRRS